jgi:hypothetical protein
MSNLETLAIQLYLMVALILLLDATWVKRNKSLGLLGISIVIVGWNL